MGKLHVGAVDCSFNNCGWCFLERDTTSKSTVIKATGIIDNSAKILPKGQRAVDDILRCQRLYDLIEESILPYYSIIRDRRAFALEIPGGSQSSRAASCLGMARGVLGSLMKTISSNQITKHCIVMVKPTEVHKKAVGSNKATKQQIMDYVVKKYKKQISMTTRRGLPAYNVNGVVYTKGQFEHIADAIVIGELGLDRLEKEGSE